MKTSQINSNWLAIPQLNREWFHERIRNKNQLLLTVGDSWTWGDSLGCINFSKKIYDDYDYRTTNVYGYHLSNLLDADWVNIAICGSSNLNVLIEAHNFLKTIEKTYDKILVVITLTESGRELLGNNILKKKKEYNILKGFDWPKFNDMLLGINVNRVINECFANNHIIGYDIELYHAIKNYKDIDELLMKYEAYTFHLIKKLFKEFIVGRNFTSIYHENKSILGDRLLSTNWTNIIAAQGNLRAYPENIRVLSAIGIKPILNYAKSLQKEQLINLVDTANTGVTWLLESPYNAKKATKHPLEQAHLWWAEYLYQNIKS